MSKRKIDGLEKALALLKELGATEQTRILEKMREKNKVLADELEEALISLEDLIYLDSPELGKFILLVDSRDLSLALKVCSPSLKGFLFTHLSSNKKKELTEILEAPPTEISKVERSYQKVLNSFQEFLKKEGIMLNKSGQDIMV